MNALITLFGNNNSGKTTILQDVVHTMIGCSPKSGDFRIAFEWKGKNIYLSTYGDDKRAILKNIDFFSCSVKCRFNFYVVNQGIVTECCHKAEKIQYFNSHQPDICVSASRNGESTLGELRFFAENNTSLRANVAVQKVCKNGTFNNVTQPLIDLIDKLK